MAFPATRLRRLRQTPTLRRLVAETRLSPHDLIYPLFVQTGKNRKEEIVSMPGQYRWSVDLLPRLLSCVQDAGIGAVMVFGLPDTKDEYGSGAYDRDGIVQQAVREIKESAPDVIVMTDTCLDEYTSHGHCGIVINGKVDNDATLELLSRVAVTQAEAGADVIAPSDMMDGRIAVIRRALDDSGFSETPVLSYAAKYASAFYGPFREAADCAPQFGDRKSYQMDPANRREAIREVELDIVEGADMVMVKPALPYLDIIREVRDRFDIPVAAYNVSGEYAMVKAGALNGWIDEQAIVLELLTSIRRAGAGMILTYHACDAGRWLST